MRKILSPLVLVCLLSAGASAGVMDTGLTHPNGGVMETGATASSSSDGGVMETGLTASGEMHYPMLLVFLLTQSLSV